MRQPLIQRASRMASRFRCIARCPNRFCWVARRAPWRLPTARWPRPLGSGCNSGCPAWCCGSSGTRWPCGAREWMRSSWRSSLGTSSTGSCWTCEDDPMMHLAEYRKRPALLADWLPWAGLVAPGVVLNKDGSFQRTARFRGPDLDSATQGELVATSARLNNALRRLKTKKAKNVEAERREAADYPDSTFPEPLSWLVDEKHHTTNKKTKNHFESAYHLTLLYLPPEESTARAAKLLYE